MPSFQYVTDSKGSQLLDETAIDKYHVPSLILMENAVISMKRKILKMKRPDLCLIMAGTGNNGADALALGRHLLIENYRVVFCLTRFSDNPQLQIQKSILDAMNAEFIDPQNLDELFSTRLNFMIIDGLFGSGLSRPLNGEFTGYVDWINARAGQAEIISIDIPSGLDGTTGKVCGTAVKADVTLALNTWRQGFFINDGPLCTGKIRLCSIGMPDLDPIAAEMMISSDMAAGWINKALVKACLMPRSPYANKGSFGKLLAIGGSLSMQGALCMACSSAWKSGVGTITCFAPKAAAKAIASKISFAMMLPAPQNEQGFFQPEAAKQLQGKIQGYTALLFGNGMGHDPALSRMPEIVLKSKKPLVIDADGLNLLSDHPDLLNQIASPVIMSPHLLEFSRLTDQPLAAVLEDPFGLARDFVKKHPEVILILKSSWTFIASKKGCFLLNEPDDHLSKGGSGDVLAGLCASLLCQNTKAGLEEFEAALKAAICAVWIHNQAARSKINPRSFDMDDLMNQYSSIFNELEN